MQFITYLAYLAISIAITVWVARTLHRNGRIFLVDAFHGNEPLADSVNQLLVVGFYLINVGYITLALESHRPPITYEEGLLFVTHKVGIVLLILGAMHFINIGIFSKMRRNGGVRHA